MKMLSKLSHTKIFNFKKISVLSSFNSTLKYKNNEATYKNNIISFQFSIIKKFDNKTLKEKLLSKSEVEELKKQQTNPLFNNPEIITTAKQIKEKENQKQSSFIRIKRLQEGKSNKKISSEENTDTELLEVKQTTNSSLLKAQTKNINIESLNSPEERITAINNKLQAFIPKKSPLELLNLKTSHIYKYSAIQLLEVVKALPLEEKNIPKMLFVLSTIRKKREFKHYETEELIKMVEFIHGKIDFIPFSYKINFFYNLSKMNYFNNDKKLVYDSALSILKAISQYNNIDISSKNESNNNSTNSIPMREVSNFIMGLSNFTMLNPKEFVFGDIFSELETVLIKNLLSVKPELMSNYIDTMSFTGIVLAYSKTQNGSVEFYKILTEIVSYLDIKKPMDLATIVYSYSNNLNCDERILYNLYDNIISTIHLAKVKELVTILRAYEKKDLLKEFPELKQQITMNFYSRFKEANPLDLAHMYKILADEMFDVILKTTPFVRKTEVRKKLKAHEKRNLINSKAIDPLEEFIKSTNEKEKLLEAEEEERELLHKINYNKDSDALTQSLTKYSKDEIISKSIINTINTLPSKHNESNSLAKIDEYQIDNLHKLLEYVEENKNKISKETRTAIKFFEYLHGQMKNLSFAFEGNEISLLFSKVNILYDLDSDLYSQLQYHVIYLIDKKKIKSKDLDIIHFNIKDIPYKKEYYTFKEKIEKALKQMNYYL